MSGPGYPYFNNGRQVRDPYTQRAMDRLDRVNDPYAGRLSRNGEQDGDYRRRREAVVTYPLGNRPPGDEPRPRYGSPEGTGSPFEREAGRPPANGPAERPRQARRAVDPWDNRFIGIPTTGKWQAAIRVIWFPADSH